MSLAGNETGPLWQSFMPKRTSIKNRINGNMISLQVYPPGYFEHFNPATDFDKWAAVEVSTYEDLPAGMDPFALKGGLYAVFLYKGSGTDTLIFEYIFTRWLPASAYALDARPHFEVLGEKYKNGSPDSEEEIWIPIKSK
jgi:AraC family transcriptional regulator